MLKYEIITCKNGIQQQHTYSDMGFRIRQIETGIIYDDVFDNIPCVYTYEETDEVIDNG